MKNTFNKDNLYYDEWKECRNTVARFDNYLLGIRTQTFSIFTLLAGSLFTLDRLNLINFNFEKTTNLSVYFLNFFFLILLSYLMLSFLLDRYYENLLAASVARSCILEIKMHHRFKVGLSTEIEALKEKTQKKHNFIISVLKQSLENAYQLLLILYILIFCFIASLHCMFLSAIHRPFLIYSSIFLYVLYLVIGFFVNKSLFKSINIISFYRKLFSSRILFFNEQIENRIFDICEDININNIKNDLNSEIVLVPVMEGARIITSKVRNDLNKIAPQIKIREYPIHISRTVNEKLSTPVLKNFGYDESFFKNKFVIIIDDLTDKGETLNLAKNIISKYSPKIIITFVIIKKMESSLMVYTPDYYCFNLEYNNEEAENRWLFGYGMDIRNEFRDCDYIAEFLTR